MVAHSKGPMYVTFEYAQFGRASHKISMPLNFAGGYEGIANIVPGVSFDVLRRDGTSEAIDVAMQRIIIFLRQWMATGGAVSGYSVYGLTSPAAEPLFLFGGEPAFALVNPCPEQHPDVQITLSFRTRLGGQYRLVFMDGPVAVDLVLSTSVIASNGTLQNWYLYMFAPECVVVGRDGAFMATGIRLVTKQNDLARRKRMGL
jgi:hypothetical protein